MFLYRFISRKTIQELLVLCAKDMHIKFTGDNYIQLDGVTMGALLVTLLANVFMCSLQEPIVPTLENCLIRRKTYVDNKHAYINADKTYYLMSKLSSYNKQTQFTYKPGKRILFLDISICRVDNGKLLTTAFRKETNTNL